MTDKIDLAPEMIASLPSARIRKLTEENAALSARLAVVEARPYHYIGKDGKTVLARDLEDRAESLEAQLAQAVEALRHCEGVFLKYQINHANGEAIEDAALAKIRATLAKIGEGHE
jgi:hypothetical protein